jgi:hypothetical protein
MGCKIQFVFQTLDETLNAPSPYPPNGLPVKVGCGQKKTAPYFSTKIINLPSVVPLTD